jgi:hypothetical protein
MEKLNVTNCKRIRKGKIIDSDGYGLCEYCNTIIIRKSLNAGEGFFIKNKFMIMTKEGELLGCCPTCGNYLELPGYLFKKSKLVVKKSALNEQK